MMGIFNHGSQTFVIDNSLVSKATECQEVFAEFAEESASPLSLDGAVGKHLLSNAQLLNQVSLLSGRGKKTKATIVEAMDVAVQRDFFSPRRFPSKGTVHASADADADADADATGRDQDSRRRSSFVRGGFGRVSLNSRSSRRDSAQHQHESYNLVEEAEISQARLQRRKSGKGGDAAAAAVESNGAKCKAGHQRDGREHKNKAQPQASMSSYKALKEALEVSRKHQGAVTKEFQRTRRSFESGHSANKETATVTSPPASSSRRSLFDHHCNGGSSEWKNLLVSPRSSSSSPLVVRPFRSVSASPVVTSRTNADAAPRNYRSLFDPPCKRITSSSNLSATRNDASRSLSPKEDIGEVGRGRQASPFASSSFVPKSSCLVRGAEINRKSNNLLCTDAAKRDFLLGDVRGGPRLHRSPAVSSLSQLSPSTPYGATSYYNSYSYHFNRDDDAYDGKEEAVSTATARSRSSEPATTIQRVPSSTSREAADKAIATLKTPSASPVPPRSPYLTQRHQHRMLSTSNRPILSQKTQGGISTGYLQPIITTYEDVHSGEKLTFVDSLPRPPSPSSPPRCTAGDDEALVSMDGLVVRSSSLGAAGPSAPSAVGRDETPQHSHLAVVAIDFGTAYSGYAFSFAHSPDDVHFMRKWQGDAFGLRDAKTPTALLLDPRRRFHSFGAAARDAFHDLSDSDVNRWFFFERFKMMLHHNKDISRGTMVKAANGRFVPALEIFAHSLRYFRDQALREITDAMGWKVSNNQIRWVVTVPAIWREQAKQFMRKAAYEAGIGSEVDPGQLLIALEPEAASIYCRKLRISQLVTHEEEEDHQRSRAGGGGGASNSRPASTCSDLVLDGANDGLALAPRAHQQSDGGGGARYMVVDCGGGTVDITVHEITIGGQDGRQDDGKQHQLREVFRATGGPYGSTSVDEAFTAMLDDMLGEDLMTLFRLKRPVG